MTIIGITGCTGAGKTSALRALKRLGALALDCDAIYHELLHDCQPMLDELRDRFPDAFDGGRLDRKKLGGVVFNDPDALRELGAITHKYVSEETDRRIREFKAGGGTLVAVDAIALIESGRAGKCDIVVGVTAPEDVRIERVMARDGVTREQAEARVRAQKPASFFEEHCDYTLTSGFDTPEEFENECEKFFAQIIGGFTNER